MISVDLLLVIDRSKWYVLTYCAVLCCAMQCSTCQSTAAAFVNASAACNLAVSSCSRWPGEQKKLLLFRTLLQRWGLITAQRGAVHLQVHSADDRPKGYDCITARYNGEDGSRDKEIG